MDNLNTGILARTPVAVPPIEEQAGIAEYIATQTGHTRTTEAAILRSIESLREYRTALISAAVTGKIDVRGERYK